MTGFDPSKFVDRERSGAGGVSPSVADGSAGIGDNSNPTETAENRDDWGISAPPVAGVATVAELPTDAPFAAELNRMFYQPCPAWLRSSAWKRLLGDARTFALGKCAEAMGKGWEPIELFGFDERPWRRMFFGRQTIGTLGLVPILRARPVGHVGEHAIEILNRLGAHQRLYRATALMNRRQSALMWDAFRPDNLPPAHGVLMGNGEIVDMEARLRGNPP